MSKTLFIGLDAADWELVSTKIASGKLPHLSRLMATGVSGPLRSIYPLFSPALWATMATGKRPYEHGITGFTLPDDAGIGLRPYNSASRRSPAIWNMFSYVKKTSNVVGWWTTAPAEAIQGAMIDETFRVARRPSHEEWEVAPKSVSPKSLSEIVAQERVHPQELSEALLRSLVPKLYEIDPSADFRLAAIAKILAEDLTTLQVTLRLMSKEPWDFTTLYLMGLDSLSHLAMRYRDPAFPGEDVRDCELYGEVLDRAYELYDTWVGQLIKAAGEETTVVIASDHGFYHDARKPTCLGIEETAPAIQHAPIGTLIMKGPHLRQGASLAHATILDLCPTLLALSDLPIGRDMPGKVLVEAFSKTPALKTISSWNKHWKPSPLVSMPSPEATEAALRQLISLGYLQEIPSNKQTAVKEAQCNQLFHLALSFLDDERIDQAIPLLERAWTESQQESHSLPRTDILAELATAYFRAGESRCAAANFHQLVRCRLRDAKQAHQEFWLKAATASTTNISFSEAWEVRRLMARANLHEEGMHFTSTLAHFLAYQKKEDLLSLFAYAEKHPQDCFANLNAGLFALKAALNKEINQGATTLQTLSEKGIFYLQRVASLCPEEADPLAFLAEYYHQTNHFIEAEECAREALRRNPLHAASWLALATTLVHQAHWEEAWKAAQQAKRSILQRSKAYLLLAKIALEGKKEPKRAILYRAMANKSEAFLKKAIHSYQAPHKKNQLDKKQPSPCVEKKKSSPPGIDPSVLKSDGPIIVSGLPRSGTSLLMQMLHAGGIPIDTDHHRQADEHNPQGYFEQEKVKNIAVDAHFLKAGTATKVVIPLVFNLPLRNCYQLIWIRRNLEEVIESQHRMAGLIATREELESVYRHYEVKTEEYIHHAAWPLLELDYVSVLQQPRKAAKAIADFLKKDLNIEAMATAVIPKLHRVQLKAVRASNE